MLYLISSASLAIVGIPDLSNGKKKILWWTELIEYSGIPFVALGRSYYRCGHGGGKLAERCPNPFKKYPYKRIHHWPCPATVRLAEYVIFPNFQVGNLFLS